MPEAQATDGLEQAQRLRSAGIALLVAAIGLGVLIPRLGPGSLAGGLDLLRGAAGLVGLPLLVVGVLRVQRARGA